MNIWYLNVSLQDFEIILSDSFCENLQKIVLCQHLQRYCCSWSFDKFAGITVGIPGMMVFSTASSLAHRLLRFLFLSDAASFSGDPHDCWSEIHK